MEPRRKVFLLELLRGDVDADGNIEVDGSPGLHLLENVLDHPFANFNSDRVAVNDRQEIGPEATGRARDAASE